MTDKNESSTEFRLRQLAHEGVTHYISTSIERNSKGFTVSAKATIGKQADTSTHAAEAEDIQHMQKIQNLMLSAAVLNIEYRKRIMVLSETQSTHDDAIAVARNEFEQWMAEYTLPADDWSPVE